MIVPATEEKMNMGYVLFAINNPAPPPRSAMIKFEMARRQPSF